MKFSKQRFSIIVMAAAIATISLATETNSVNAEPPPPANQFSIEVKLNSGNPYEPSWYDRGRFQATGTTKDNGRVFAAFDHVVGMRVMELYGKHGDMDIALWTDENGERLFIIIDATGEHSAFVGVTGTRSYYSELKRNGDVITYSTLNGSISS